MTPIASQLRAARAASFAMAALPTAVKDEALEHFALAIDGQRATLLAANQADLDEQKGRIAQALYQRLKLDDSKLTQLIRGIRDVIRLPDPAGRILERMELDRGLLREKRSVPLGVIAVIFESRPDVIPQVLSLLLKSGNVGLLKGGAEARRSNQAFMRIVREVNAGMEAKGLPTAWAQLFETRADVHEILKYPEYVDLVIPRGSNQLVQTIMQATRIPVLGHADGVCHLYVDRAADIVMAVDIAVDAKTQYPAVCNSIETLLVHSDVVEEFFRSFIPACRAAGVELYGCEVARRRVSSIERPVSDWHREFGELELNVRIVDSLEAAVAHINTHGSHHTDAIVSGDPAALEAFAGRVDSSSVLANASTRFADGYRYGFGAEIGISTSKTHARGPVGLEGLVLYKHVVLGSGQRVADYVGPKAKPFLHRRLPPE